MTYRQGSTEDDLVELRDAINEFARTVAGPFSANDVGIHLLSRPVQMNAGTWNAVLNDMVDLGELDRFPDDGGPHRYQSPSNPDPERG